MIDRSSYLFRYSAGPVQLNLPPRRRYRYTYSIGQTLPAGLTPKRGQLQYLRCNILSPQKFASAHNRLHPQAHQRIQPKIVSIVSNRDINSVYLLPSLNAARRRALCYLLQQYRLPSRASAAIPGSSVRTWRYFAWSMITTMLLNSSTPR